MKREHSDTLAAFDRLQTRGFDVLAKYYPGELIFNGKKATVITSPIANEYVMEIVNFVVTRSASVEIKLTDLNRLGCTNESYVSLDGVVLRLRQLPQDGTDIALKFYAHSTPDQGAAAAAAAQDESGSVALTAGQVEVFVNFAARKATRNYVFTELYIEKIGDPNPIAISVTPFDRTIDNFKLALGAVPDTTGYVLYWAVKL
jgi:hypothetical protein